MRLFIHLIALVCVLAVASGAWFGLAGVMAYRSDSQEQALVGSVSDLWGTEHSQQAPELVFHYEVDVVHLETRVDSKGRVITDASGDAIEHPVTTQEKREVPVRVASSRIGVDLTLDQRRKGLLWYSLYDVDFDGQWTYTHTRSEAGTLAILYRFPDTNGVYDGFSYTVDGEERSQTLETSYGNNVAYVDVEPGQTVQFAVAYQSRGRDRWSYRPIDGAGQINDFQLAMTTDFADIDYPSFTMSPSSREQNADGWLLRWDFERIVTGNGMGMVMPQRVQPGPLAAKMSLSAPISLGLFMAWIVVLALLKGIEVHPVNHAFLAAAFFAFHLLFGYTADHLPVEWAFALSAGVSVVLVVSYLRLVVGPRFAFLEAGMAQLIYLVGFSLAHFWDGLTGLTVTVLGVGTLFALMMLTGRIRWSEVFGEAPPIKA